MTGAELIAAERARQVDTEGWNDVHDDEHGAGDLTAAARCYALYAWRQALGTLCGWTTAQLDEIIFEDWPWDETWWKPSDDPIRNLAKAGALIAAEIDRLQRLQPQACPHCGATDVVPLSRGLSCTNPWHHGRPR